MKKFTSCCAKNFDLAKKLNFILLLLFFLGTNSSLNAHAVQTAWCWAPGGESVRVYIEHWHGPGQNVDCGAGATINVSVAINGEAPITYNNIPFNQNIPGTLATLPHDDRLPIQVISTCSGANTENDWGSWDFPLPEGLCPDGGSIQITVLSANDCVFDEACQELYPATTNTVIVPADCPCTVGLPGTDADGDGWIDECDCNDNDPNVNPGVDEVCGNGIDDDCDGVIDSDDDDGDGFGACDGDCDDNNPTVYPGAPELCDALDNDCDGVIPSSEVDADGDGFACDDCDDNNPNVYPLAPEICDGLDNDCDGIVDNVGDQDGDGFSFCEDCDDLDPTVYPGAPELCDGLDNDCDGTDPSNELYDADGDGYSVCAGDCDDTDPALNPGATEVLGNGIDDNCDGLVDILPYCTPTISTPCYYMWITNVTIEDINNTTTCNTAYSNFIGQSTNLTPGNTYTISVTGGGSYNQYTNVYIDWNLDGDFDDSGEKVVSNLYTYYYSANSSTFTVPTSAAGSFRMRVISDYYSSPGSCYTQYGEVEDYTVITCTDTDGDGICGVDDNCPNVSNAGQEDNDNDGMGDVCDDDDDNDGIIDTDEMACGSDPLNAASTCEVCDGIDNDLDGSIDEGFVDTDGDSMADCVDPDDDNDGVLDVNDSAPLDNFVCQDLDGDGCDDCASGTVDASNDGTDTDGDGLCDLGDSDDDNDGCLDEDDDNPLVASEDTDNDGTANDCDDDDDGDGVLDGDDLAPLNRFICQDLDGDGCDDCASGTVDASNDGTDTDGDGLCDFGDADDDNDGVLDVNDSAPLDNFVCQDLDGDGCDDCASGTVDASNDGTDTDGDGLCDFGDTDDDNDGCLDEDDDNPLVASEDTDNDGTANDCDDDDDGDGVLDVDDLDPLDNFVCQDLDEDGCDDCASGIVDASNDGLDTDGDGLCDLGDPDDDNDGIEDECDSNPLVDNFIFNGIENLPAEWICGNNSKKPKVYICHIPAGNPDNAHTICVSPNAVQAHLDHGCMLGECNSCSEEEGDNTRIAGEQILKGMTLYPNPAIDNISLLFETSRASRMNIIVSDAMGKTMLRQDEEAVKGGNEIRLDVGNWINGVYFIRIEIGLRVHALRFVKTDLD